MQMIFQDPMASLNERAKVDYIIAEGLINQHNKPGFKHDYKNKDRIVGSHTERA